MAIVADAPVVSRSVPAYLYVIALDPDRIKVGYTVDPMTRLALHRGLAEAHGCVPGREWTSPRGAGTPAREAALIAFCAERASTQFRSEYFVGVAFDEAVRAAAEVCGDMATLRRLDRNARAARRRRFQAMTRGRTAASFEEAAAWLGVTVAALRALASSGALPVLRVGSQERVPVTAVAALYEDQRATSVP